MRSPAPVLGHLLAPGRHPQPFAITDLPVVAIEIPSFGRRGCQHCSSARPAAIQGVDDKPSDDSIAPKWLLQKFRKQPTYTKSPLRASGMTAAERYEGSRSSRSGSVLPSHPIVILVKTVFSRRSRRKMCDAFFLIFIRFLFRCGMCSMR
jgi:hypothetical protein